MGYELMGRESDKEVELRALMLASLNGNAAAYRKLLGSLSGHLRAYYRIRLKRTGRGAEEESEDLVQETLLAVHIRRDSYKTEELFTPWVYAIARYKLIDHLRHTRSRHAHVPIERASDVMALEDQGAIESRLDLNKLLARIPKKARMTIRYVKIDGLSITEAAARCGISEAAVKINVHRGLKAISSSIVKDKAK